jgi:hypothetical protein
MKFMNMNMKWRVLMSYKNPENFLSQKMAETFENIRLTPKGLGIIFMLVVFIRFEILLLLYFALNMK